MILLSPSAESCVVDGSLAAVFDATGGMMSLLSILFFCAEKDWPVDATAGVERTISSKR